MTKAKARVIEDAERPVTRVRDLFDQARTRGPAIVFIDEIDALGSRRDHGGFAGNDEREQTLNQLLAEMDGFDDSRGVVMLAATNRPDADFNKIAAATPGFSGANLANLVNEAAPTAVRDGRISLTAADFADARDRMLLGTRHTIPLAAGELATVAALATQMVREFGLSDKLGPVSYSDPPDGLSGLGPRTYSEHTQWLVDQEVTALLTSAESRARNLLTRHREALTQLTAALMEQETITGDQIRALARAASAAGEPRVSTIRVSC